MHQMRKKNFKYDYPTYSNTKLNLTLIQSMECSSMISLASLGPGDPGSNPGWFAVLNSNKKLSLH